MRRPAITFLRATQLNSWVRCVTPSAVRTARIVATDDGFELHATLAGSTDRWVLNWVGDTGSFQEDVALNVAETFLDKVVSGAPATGNYNLTSWLNGASQDLIQATTPTGTVPEPATALLGALGLAGIAAVRRRKA